MQRFTEDSFSNGNGRVYSWRYYLGVFESSVGNLIFGASSKIPMYVSAETGIGVVQHNTLIEALSEIGLLGTISLVAVFTCLFKTVCTKYREYSFRFLIPVLVELTGYFFINALYSDTLTVSTYVCFLAAKIAFIKENMVKNDNCSD